MYRAENPYTDNLFRKHIKNKINTIVELGCNKFHYTRDMLDTYNPKILHAFEPHPKTVKFCENNIFDERIHFYPYAVGDHNCEIEFFDFGPTEETTCSSIFRREHLKELQYSIGNVQCVRLDSIFDKNYIIDLLCMDIQGSEVIAMKGCGDLLMNISYIILEIPNENPPTIMHKLAPKREDCIEFLNNNEFVLVESIRENDFEDNVLFVKKNLMLNNKNNVGLLLENNKHKN